MSIESSQSETLGIFTRQGLTQDSLYQRPETVPVRLRDPRNIESYHLKSSKGQETLGDPSLKNQHAIKVSENNLSKDIVTPLAQEPGQVLQTNGTDEKAKPRKPWRPDVFVQAYIPHAFLAVNSAPALFCDSPPILGIDYVDYVSKFASPLFLPQTPLNIQLSLTSSQKDSVAALNEETYGPYFSDAIQLDLQAQEPEVRSYDRFGVELFPINSPDMGILSLHVPGLREETPRVAYGDTVLLRQLIIDPHTKLPYSKSHITNSGHTAYPGFTGYQISATVTGVDRANEIVRLRAVGVFPVLSGPLRFNVSFIVQTQRIQCLQRAINDTSSELQLLVAGNTNRQDRQSWMQCMLFPTAEDGVRRKGLPRGTFTQQWVDPALNYEQKVGRGLVSIPNNLKLTYR